MSNSPISSQVVQPGGSTTHRLDELLKRPAAEVLRQGERPPKLEISTELSILGVRAMEGAEAPALAMRLMGEDVRSSVNLTDKIKVRHHTIARMMAAGAKDAEIQRLLGCAPSTLSTLKRSPAFQALLLEYMNMLDSTAIDSYQRLQIVGNLGIDELTDRLATRAASIKTSEVLEIVKVAADRTGLGPTTKQVTLNGRLSPADIRAVKTTVIQSTADYSEETPLGGVGDGASVYREQGAPDEPSEGGNQVRAVVVPLACTSYGDENLIADVGEILGL